MSEKEESLAELVERLDKVYEEGYGPKASHFEMEVSRCWPRLRDAIRGLEAERKRELDHLLMFHHCNCEEFR